jgi:hypothetical protein
MDLHPPGGPVRSVKDFFVHIGVVTLGILIALGLEQLVEAHHRANLAKIAVAGFRKELAYNEDEVKYVLTRLPELQGKIERSISTLSAAPFHRKPSGLTIPASLWTSFPPPAGTRLSPRKRSMSCPSTR